MAHYDEFTAPEDIACADFRFSLFAKPSLVSTRMDINRMEVIEMKTQVYSVKKDKFVKCLLCNQVLDLGVNFKVGKYITCKNCEMVYEIINIDPVMIDWPYYDDDCIDDEEIYDYE
jgi:transcription elongation factor Elf1